MTEQARLEIEYRHIDAVSPYENNTRTHSDEQIEQIKRSIVEFGVCTPIGIRQDIIVYGHARHQAMLELGHTEIACLDLSHLSDTQFVAYVMTDNKSAENAGWDMELTKTEIEFLLSEEFDIDLLCFSDEELDEILGDLDEELDLKELEYKENENFLIKCENITEMEELKLFLSTEKREATYHEFKNMLPNTASQG